MLRAWLARAEFERASGSKRDEDHLAAWLHIVARNLAVDARRRDRTVPVGIVPPALLYREADSGTPAADTVLDRLMLVRALRRLSPHHRDVLAHVHLYDRSREETARLLGVPKGTVKSRLHYALAALRTELPAA